MIQHSIQDNELVIDGFKVSDLLRKYQSPLYVISYTQLKSNINNLKEHFSNKYNDVRIHYAVKANFNMALAQIMQKNDLGLDVVSVGEIAVAKAAGFDLSKIEYNGNNKTYTDLEYAISNGIGYIIIDNEAEVGMIDEIAFKHQVKVNVLFRITPNVSDGAHAHINTGQKDSKFGIPTIDNNFIKVFEKALVYKNISILGLHFHVGSQLLKNDSFLKSLNYIQGILITLKDTFNYEVKILNIGGGFGIEYTKEDITPSLDHYFTPIMEQIEKIFNELNYQRPSIVIEPGRYIIGEAGFTLYEVGLIKEIPNIKKYVGVSGGMADNIRPALYEAKYNAVVANNMDSSEKEIVSIAGNCCESGDVIIKDINLPVIKTNDVICVFATGAYNYSMASNYNKNLIPATLLIENGVKQVIVKRQSLEQLTINDENLTI